MLNAISPWESTDYLQWCHLPCDQAIPFISIYLIAMNMCVCANAYIQINVYSLTIDNYQNLEINVL